MKVLVTGAAGFIGFHVARRLLDRGDEVVGLDNLNDYYDPTLKEARLAILREHPRFSFVKLDLADRAGMDALFAKEEFQRVVHLAAQAGVRYSVTNPHAYVDSNVTGTLHVLEGCRHNQVEHLVFASTSSVYGANTKMPFSVHQHAEHPLSFYAATKKANEMMAHTHAYLYGLPVTGLRFFTVYGPWGRPDMALFLFTRKILAGEPTSPTSTTSSAAWWRRSTTRRSRTPTGTATRRIPRRARRRTGSTTSATIARSSCVATSRCSRIASAARRR